MKRGEIWTTSGPGYAGKPRPAVIVQDERFDTHSLTICLLTTNSADAPLFRVSVIPGERNGLRHPSRLMVDKLVTVPRSRLGSRIGVLDDEDIVRLNRAIMVFLGLA